MQAGQVAGQPVTLVCEIGQLSVVSSLIGNPKLQVLLLSYGADKIKALFLFSW